MSQSPQNLALGKRVLEECNTPEQMLDGQFDFDGVTGYCGVHVPAYLTIDLGEACTLRYIRFLLMNRGKQDTNHGTLPREYYYRLLAATDPDTTTVNDDTCWTLLYDGEERGHTDWQCFTLEKPVTTRFLRVHAIENRKNNGFHIIQFEAYEQTPEPYAEAKIDVDATIDIDQQPREIGDGLPLYKRLNDLTSLILQINANDANKELLEISVKEKELQELEKIIDKVIMQNLDNNEAGEAIIRGEDVVKVIAKFANDVRLVERNTDGIERAVISPVHSAITESGRSNKTWTLWGLWSAIISIFLIILNKVISHGL